MMLSAGLQHHYPQGFGHLSPENMGVQTDQMSPQHGPMTGLDALAQGSHYMQLQEQNLQNSGAVKHARQNPIPYGNASDDSAGAGHKDSVSSARSARSMNQPVRRRISRACDQCNQLRTKCDGKTPCAHCVGECPLFCARLPEYSLV